jgi:hypothetical protein
MVAYLVNQIILGKLTYNEVVTARPDLQAKIDAYIDDKSITIDKTV